MSNQFVERLINQNLTKENIFLEDIAVFPNHNGELNEVYYKYKFQSKRIAGKDLFYYGKWRYHCSRSMQDVIEDIAFDIDKNVNEFKSIYDIAYEHFDFIEQQVLNRYYLLRKKANSEYFDHKGITMDFLRKYGHIRDFMLGFEKDIFNADTCKYDIQSWIKNMSNKLIDSLINK